MSGEAVTGLKSDALDKCEYGLAQCAISKQDGFYSIFICCLTFESMESYKLIKTLLIMLFGLIMPNCFILDSIILNPFSQVENSNGPV